MATVEAFHMEISGKEEIEIVLDEMDRKTEAAKDAVNLTIKAVETAIETMTGEQKEKVRLMLDQLKAEMAATEQKAKQEFDKIKVEKNTAEASLKETEMHAELTTMKVMSIVHHCYSLLTGIMSAFGESLPPVISALISTAFTVVGTLMTMGKSMMSNPYTAVLGIITIASAFISLAAAIDAQMKLNEVQRTIEESKNATASHQSRIVMI